MSKFLKLFFTLILFGTSCVPNVLADPDDGTGYAEIPWASFANDKCKAKVDPSSQAMAYRMFNLLNEYRQKLGAAPLLMSEEMQCRAQISDNHVLDSIRDHTKADLTKNLALRPGEDFTAEYGDFLDELPKNILDKRVTTNAFSPYLPFQSKYTQVGIGYAVDSHIEGSPAYAAWIIILT